MLTCLVPLHAQPFSFSYPGPFTIGVETDCSTYLAGKLGTPNVSSNVGATITVSALDSVATGFGLYTPITTGPQTIKWLVEDNQGNTALYTFLITMVDNTPPVFDTIATPRLLNLASINQLPTGQPPLSDNCTPVGQISIVYSQTTAPGVCQGGSFTRTWTATDNVGNSSVYTQIVVVSTDNEAPTLGSLPQGASPACMNLPTQYGVWLNAQLALFTSGASDPSGIKSITFNGPSTYPAGCPAPVTVTFRATDNCNLFRTASATFSVSDTQAPVIVSPARDTVFYCTNDSSFFKKVGEYIHNRGWIEASDCRLTPRSTWQMKVNGPTLDSAGVVDALVGSFSQPCGIKLVGIKSYAKVRAWIPIDFFVRDSCGQLTVDRGELALIDTLGPKVSGTITTEPCGGGNDQSALETWIKAHGNALVEDGCSGVTLSNSFSFVTSTGQTGTGTVGAGPYPLVLPNHCEWHVDVTFTATDACGNLGTGALRFQVRDTQGPAIAVASDTTIYCPSDVPAQLPKPAVTDNCDPNPQVDSTRQVVPDADPLCLGNYTVRVIWKATDQCGNTSTAVQIFLVRDTIGPTFGMVPTDLTIYCDTFALPPVPITGINIFATDDCSPAVIINTQTSSSQNPNPAVCGHYSYALTRIFTAMDGCGNTRQASQTINVIDDQGPVLSGLADTVMRCDVPPLPPRPIAIDACSGPVSSVTLHSSKDSVGFCTDAYTRVYTYRAFDVCGNFGEFEQRVHVRDTVAPILIGVPNNVTVSCENIPVPPATNTLVAQDNCDDMVDISFQVSEIRAPNQANCAHWHDYIIQRTWTVTDNCGNNQRYTQSITVRDDTPPILTLPGDAMRPADLGQCSANVPIPAPVSVYDLCTSTQTTIVLADSLLMTAANTSVPVNPMNFQWAAPNMPPAQPAIGTATVRFFISNADINNPTEYFDISVEGSNIGRTNTTGGTNNCASDNSTVIVVSANQLNQWLADGQLNMTLTSNGSSSGAVNLGSCPSGPARVRAVWTYQIASPQAPLTLTYKLDTFPETPYLPNSTANIPVGQHTILYTVKDCAGNISTASLRYTVQDLEPPSITPPANLTVFTGTTDCAASAALPFPVISENCTLAGSLLRTSTEQPILFEADPDLGLIPQNTGIFINGLIPNAVGGGRLRIFHVGDNAAPGKFFNVYDETSPTGVNLGQTDLGPMSGRCDAYNETIINVSAAQINAWAANGSASFTLVPNQIQDAINNCGAFDPMNQQDGISKVYATLEYNYARVTYSVSGGPTVVPSDTLRGNQTVINNLSPGTYTVRYSVTDAAGIIGTAQFQLIVRDTVRPKAICKPLVNLQVNASGLPGDVSAVTVSDINNNSTDNCPGTLQYALSRTTFSCADAVPPFLYNVTLTVTDAAGNSAACNSPVRVRTADLIPSYNTGVCEQGTLFLFANVALVQGVEAYSYRWTGPGGLTSLEKNPMFSNATTALEGAWTLTITALTAVPGCSATGVVNVDLNNLNVTPVLSADSNSYCIGENIRLKTNPYGGGNVRYQWYRRFPNRDSLLTTTTAESHVLNNWPVGNYRFFVKIVDGACPSVNSNELLVNVFSLPVAQVFPEFIRVCEGVSFSLGTLNGGSGVSFRWVGPGLTSTMPSPTVNNPRDGIDEGNYILTVTQNGCTSKPDTALVTVDATPPAPDIDGDYTDVCEGGSLIMTCKPNTAADFLWIGPMGDTSYADTNAIVIPGANQLQHGGNWKVVVITSRCPSAISPLHPVRVLSYPRISPKSNAPLCQGDTLKLEATASLPNLDWEWRGPGNFAVFNQTTKRFPPVSGTYFIRAATKSLPVCADTVEIDVSVLAPPVIDTLLSDAPTCASGTTDARIWAKVSNAQKPLQFCWTRQSIGGSPTITPDSFLVIPSISKANNDNYTLVVKNAAGCPSASKSITLNVRDVPVLPVLKAEKTEVCPGENISLFVENANIYGTFDVEYFWETPRGPGTSEEPELNRFTVSQRDSGLYKVRVRVGQCTTGVASISIRVKSQPPKPTATALQNTLCTGEPLSLSALPVIQGATYAWQGPINANGIMVSIPSVSLTDGGDYRVTLTKEGCASEPSDPLRITVKQRPVTPFALPATPSALCLEQVGTVKFAIQPDMVTQGTSYQWFHQGTNRRIGKATSDIELLLPVDSFQFLSPGVHAFYVLGTLNGCASLYSNPIEVRLDDIPNSSAFAGGDTLVCDGRPLVLNATQPTIGSGVWSLVSGPNDAVIANPSDPKTMVSKIKSVNTYQFKWTLSNGACVDYSSDVVNVQVNKFVAAEVARDIDTCAGGSAIIRAIKGGNPKGRWSQMPIQAGLGVVIETPDSFQTVVRGLQAGQNYVFTWTLNDIGCGSTSTDLKVRVFSTNVSAGNDINPSCSSSGNEQLNATPVQLGIGETARWETVTPGLTLSDPNNPNATVSGLKFGDNILRWVTNNGRCGTASEDEVVIRYVKPALVNPTFMVPFGGNISGADVLKDSKVPTNFTIDIFQEPVRGNISTTTEKGKYNYTPNQGFFGTDSIKFTVTHAECTNVSSIGTAYFIVDPPESCVIPTIITPNNDTENLNEMWILSPACYFAPTGEGVQKITVKVSVFNQWGDEVYRSQDYETDTPWDGTHNGEPLPTGTYFFILQKILPDGSHLETVKHFILIQR